MSDDPDQNAIAIDDRYAGDVGGAKDQVGFLEGCVQRYDDRVDGHHIRRHQVFHVHLRVLCHLAIVLRDPRRG